MTSTVRRVIAILTILCCQQNAALSTAVLSVDPRCNVNNGIVADMNNCSGFIICLHGRVRRVITCSKGLLFDTERRMCNHQYNVDCGSRPLNSDASTENCVLTNIKLTLKVENDVQRPFFNLQTTLQAPRQALENFMLMAAGKDSRFRFESQQVENFGMFVTTINGLRADSASLTAWVPFDRFNREIDINIGEYIPEDNDTIIFKFLSFGTQPQGCTGSGCRTVNSRLLGG